MQPAQPGNQLELVVSDLTVEGGAIARHDGLVYFLDKGLPGERVLARVESLATRFARAVVLQTLAPSPQAAEPFCPHFGACGGCAWQNLQYPAQLDWKAGQIKENLKRLGGISQPEALKALENLQVIPSPEVTEYRNKMEYVFALQEGELCLGLRRRASRQVEPISRCRLQSPQATAALQEAVNWAKRNKLTAWDGRSGNLRHLIVREPRHIVAEQANGQQLAVELISFAPPPQNMVKELADALQDIGVTTFIHSVRRHKSAIAQGERRLFQQGADLLYEQFGPLNLAFPPSAFMQTNTGAATLLAEALHELFRLLAPSGAELPGTLWDIYCGSGFFALRLAPELQKVVAFEQNKDAVRVGIDNARRLGIANCRFCEGEAEKSLAREKTRPDIIVCDPPRAGMHPDVLRIIKERAPRGIICVSCAPATLARDLKQLAPEYSLRAIRAVDMFPHTPHVECVALLTR